MNSLPLDDYSHNDLAVSYTDQLERFKSAQVQWRFNAGVPLFYHMPGRRLFGASMKHPLMRFGHCPEKWLRNHLQLDFSGGSKPRYKTPGKVSIPDWAKSWNHPYLPMDIL